MMNSFSKMLVEQAIEYFKDLSSHQESEHHKKFDLIISASEDVFLQIEDELVENRDAFLITLEPEDLGSKQVLIDKIYSAVFEQDPNENLDLAQKFDAIESYFPVWQKCIVSVIDYDDCAPSAQENLLSLLVVSNVFAVLLRSEQNTLASTQELQKLLNLLSDRVLLITHEDEYEDDLSVYEDQDDFQNNEQADLYEEQNHDAYDEQHPGVEDQSEQQKAWYQLIPKYHLTGALVLILLVIALWNFDLNKEKQQTIDLDIAPVEAVPVQELSETETQQDNKLTQTVDEQASEMQSSIDKTAEEKVTEKNIQQESEADIVEVKAPVKTIQEPVKPTVIKPKQSTSSQVNWSPYQSSAWIKQQDPKTFTLQILASHNEQGIRDFFLQQGSNSQYAVYTTLKNNKPWHVVIYGVFPSHEKADMARTNLPDYLQKQAPWIRPMSDIQKSLN